MKNIMIILMVCVLSFCSLNAYSQQMVVYNNYGYGNAPSVPTMHYYAPSVWSPYTVSPQPYTIYYPVVPVPVYQTTNMIPATIQWQPTIYQWNHNIYYRRGCFGNYYYYYYR